MWLRRKKNLVSCSYNPVENSQIFFKSLARLTSVDLFQPQMRHANAGPKSFRSEVCVAVRVSVSVRK